jgi:hypothetical protein
MGPSSGLTQKVVTELGRRAGQPSGRKVRDLVKLSVLDLLGCALAASSSRVPRG